MERVCPCNLSKKLDQCCGRFHSGKQNAKTPEQLMRSRYSAYCLGNLGQYLLATWWPATVNGLTSEVLNQKMFNWKGLTIIDKSQQGDNGIVEFEALFTHLDAEKIEVMHERSSFKRQAGQWFYVSGEQL